MDSATNLLCIWNYAYEFELHLLYYCVLVGKVQCAVFVLHNVFLSEWFLLHDFVLFI